MKFRTVLLGLSALFVAGCAAYFSVLGLSKLFAGASTAVIVMASSLELAKLITAGFLYNYWESINKILRIYLLIGTLVLITITSAGIYGFLTSAYQTTADQLAVMDKQIEIVNLKKSRYQEEVTTYSAEREQINNTIGELSKGLSNNVIQYTDTTGRLITTTSSATRRVLTNQLNDNKTQRDKITEKMDVLNDSITSMDLKALSLQTGNEVAAEVGPLKYLSKITGWEMNKIVNYFALFIIFVFDPLAVTLIVAFNTALKVDGGEKDKKRAEKLRTVYGEKEEEEEEDELSKEVEEAWDSFFSDEENEPNDDLKKAKKVQEQYLQEMMKNDEDLGLYDTGSSESGIENYDEDAEGLPPNNDDIEEPQDPNDIEVTYEHIIPEDLNQDGIVTPDEQKKAGKLREKYLKGNWNVPYNGKPYFHHPWFDWNNYKNWINDPHAVEFFKKFRGGNQSQIDKYRNSPYPTDFSSKTY